MAQLVQQVHYNKGLLYYLLFSHDSLLFIVHEKMLVPIINKRAYHVAEKQNN